MSDLINDTKIKRNFIARLCNPKQVGYISTIGVIEEVRKIGIGKALLSQAIGILKINKKCIGVYMHVITHNKSAINFYASNEFCRGKYLENHYFIERNHYDCIVFYKLFASNKMEIKSSETLTIRDGKEKREIENICPTFDKVIIPCVQTNLVNQEEIENKENLEILNENSSLLK